MKSLRILLVSLFAVLSIPAFAADYAVSWGITDPTGITEYVIAGQVAGVQQPLIFTGSTELSRTVSRAVTPGQTVTFAVSACNAAYCGAWGPVVSLIAESPLAGTVNVTTATAVRMVPPVP